MADAQAEQLRWLEKLKQERAQRIAQARVALDRLEETGEWAVIQVDSATPNGVETFERPAAVTVEVPEGPPA